MTNPNNVFMQEAIALSIAAVRSNLGGPFGAVIVKDGKIIAKGSNRVFGDNDPTAHAEIMAIRAACQALQTFQLQGCELYTSCEPCPMCLGGIYWAGLERVYYANTQVDAAHIGFSDEFLYRELQLPIGERQIPMMQMMRQEALSVFQEWAEKPDRVDDLLR
jgi:tRNA(Arg) A34 adenosine deaminase TadA